MRRPNLTDRPYLPFPEPRKAYPDAALCEAFKAAHAFLSQPSQHSMHLCNLLHSKRAVKPLALDRAVSLAAVMLIRQRLQGEVNLDKWIDKHHSWILREVRRKGTAYTAHAFKEARLAWLESLIKEFQ